jgi:hypothetical protein
MENIYLQIIQSWLFIQALMNEKEKQMAQPPETMTERGGLNLEILDGDERVKLIGEICQELTVQQLKQVRELADQKRLEKI